MEAKEVAPFTLTYQRQMTGELGYTNQALYEFWLVFVEQALQCFSHTHKAEKFLREMTFVKYRGDIAKFLLEMENLNIHHRGTRIAWREMIEDEIRQHALQ